jgi:hypothetical protein
MSFPITQAKGDVMKCKISKTCHIRHWWTVDYKLTGLEKEPYRMCVATDTRSRVDALGAFLRQIAGHTLNKPVGLPVINYARSLHFEAH